MVGGVNFLAAVAVVAIIITMTEIVTNGVGTTVTTLPGTQMSIIALSSR